MAEMEVLKKKQKEFELIQQKENGLQRSKTFSPQQRQMERRLEQGMKQQINREDLQQRREAEKQAGLAQKQIPEQEIPAEVMKQMETEYAAIHKGKTMSDKQRKDARKDYRKKIKRTGEAQKILEEYNGNIHETANLILQKAKSVVGKNDLVGNVRKNQMAAAWLGAFTGESPIGMVNTLLRLSVKAKDATPEQAERKALEIEKMFQVILDYDISKLKYKNGDDFLKNAAENMKICGLAMEMDHQLASYRELVELGKLEKPVNPKIVNEVDARVNLMMSAMNRVESKLYVMASEKYAMMDKDSADSMSDDYMDQKIDEAKSIAENAQLPPEVRKKAESDIKYYKNLNKLRDFDEVRDKTHRFKRGDDPEKLLAAHRKEVNQKHPIPKGYKEVLEKRVQKEEEIRSIEKDGIERFRKSSKHRLNEHAIHVNSNVRTTAHTYRESKEFAYRTFGKHWDNLRTDQALRRQMIQKYYGELHRGRKIPDELLQKIEKNFEQKFELVKKTDPSASYAGQAEHDSRVKKFTADHEKEIKVDRIANAALYLFRDLDEEKQVEKYNNIAELFSYDTENETKQLSEDKKEELLDKNKELLEYVTTFDLEKLEFKDISELAPRFEEINHYVQIMGEMQKLPRILYRLGIVDDDFFVLMQARVELVMGYTGLFHNAISSHSTILDALVDPEDMLAVNEAEDLENYDSEDDIPAGEEGELIRDKDHFEKIPQSEENIELLQYIRARSNLGLFTGTSFYKPGDTMENAMKEAMETAKKKLNNLKAEK